MIEYIIFENELYPENSCIKGIDATGGEHFIPEDPENSDYQQYLAWVEQNSL